MADTTIDVTFDDREENDIQLIQQLNTVMAHAESQYDDESIEAALAWFRIRYMEKYSG